jgi:hypothetical protein
MSLSAIRGSLTSLSDLMMRTQTYVLGWAAYIVLSVAVLCCSVQLSRPDDDWEGWLSEDWNNPVPYRRPRWGVPAVTAKADSTCGRALSLGRLVEERHYKRRKRLAEATMRVGRLGGWPPQQKVSTYS